MIENWILFTAGVVGVLFAFGHSAWGQRFIMPMAESTPVKDWMYVSFNQTTIAQLFKGIAMINASTYVNPTAPNLLIWLVGLTNTAYVLWYLGVNRVRHRKFPEQATMRVGGAMLFIALIFAGLR